MRSHPPAPRKKTATGGENRARPAMDSQGKTAGTNRTTPARVPAAALSGQVIGQTRGQQTCLGGRAELGYGVHVALTKTKAGRSGTKDASSVGGPAANSLLAGFRPRILARTTQGHHSHSIQWDCRPRTNRGYRVFTRFPPWLWAHCLLCQHRPEPYLCRPWRQRTRTALRRNSFPVTSAPVAARVVDTRASAPVRGVWRRRR